MSRHYGNFDSGNGNGLLQTTRRFGSESWTAAGPGASAWRLERWPTPE